MVDLRRDARLFTRIIDSYSISPVMTSVGVSRRVE
jgi:hypothetical protein